MLLDLIKDYRKERAEERKVEKAKVAAEVEPGLSEEGEEKIEHDWNLT